MGGAETVRKAALEVFNSGLTLGTWGNVSYREGVRVYITPSGVPYEELTESDIAVLDLTTGEQISGREKRSSEYLLHMEIYRNFPEINAVVHTHSVHASAFASIGREIPCLTEDQAQIIGGRVPVCEYAPPGTAELARNVVEILKRRKTFGVLMKKHGAVAIGRSMKEAIIASQIIEKSAQIAHVVLCMVGNVEEISEDEVEELREGYLRSYSHRIAR